MKSPFIISIAIITSILVVGLCFLAWNSFTSPTIEENDNENLDTANLELQIREEELGMGKIQNKVQNLEEPLLNISSNQASEIKIVDSSQIPVQINDTTLSPSENPSTRSDFLPMKKDFLPTSKILFKSIRLENKRSERCFDIKDQRAEIWDCDDNLDSQEFVFEFSRQTVQDTSNNSVKNSPTFKILTKGSKTCLNVFNLRWAFRTEDNSPINAISCIDPTPSNQLWYMRHVKVSEREFSIPSANGQMLSTASIKDFMKNYRDFGYFQLVGVESEKCVDALHGSSDNGVKLNIYDCERVAGNQLWKFY